MILGQAGLNNKTMATFKELKDKVKVLEEELSSKELYIKMYIDKVSILEAGLEMERSETDVQQALAESYEQAFDEMKISKNLWAAVALFFAILATIASCSTIVLLWL